MDRRLLAARGVGTAVWLASVAEAATVQVDMAKNWAGLGEMFGPSDYPPGEFLEVLMALTLLLASLAPLCVGGSLGAALWLAGDIWVKWAKVVPLEGRA